MADTSPAAFARRRTCCVWCGRRIPGTLDSTGPFAPRVTADLPALRFAARVACAAHRDLVLALDAYYNGTMHSTADLSAREGMVSC